MKMSAAATTNLVPGTVMGNQAAIATMPMPANIGHIAGTGRCQTNQKTAPKNATPPAVTIPAQIEAAAGG